MSHTHPSTLSPGTNAVVTEMMFFLNVIKPLSSWGASWVQYDTFQVVCTYRKSCVSLVPFDEHWPRHTRQVDYRQYRQKHGNTTLQRIYINTTGNTVRV